MLLLTFVSFLSVLVSLPSETSGCSPVTEQSFSNHTCSRLNYSYILVDGRRVPFGSENVSIQLEESTKQVNVSCGGHNDIIYWTITGKDGNQIRVSFIENTIKLHVYWCESFKGPEKASKGCAVEAFSPACPGQVGDGHTCVYEVKAIRFSGDTVRNAVQVTTKVAARVREKARVSVSLLSHTAEEHTVVNTYPVDSRSYIVIPAGYRFCSFSKVVSKKDYLEATGFKRSCTLPTFIQTNAPFRFSERCTKLALCKTKSPCSTSPSPRPSHPDSGAKSAAVVQPQPIAMLLALCVIVSGKLANCAA